MSEKNVFLDSVYLLWGSPFSSVNLSESQVFFKGSPDHKRILVVTIIYSVFRSPLIKEYLKFKGFNLLGHSAAEISPNKNPVSEGKHYNKKTVTGKVCFLLASKHRTRSQRPQRRFLVKCGR